MNVAFFGGSFNPPHVAHVLAVAYVLSMGQFDRVLVVPVFEHAFKKPLCSFAQRLEMCERAFGWLPNVEISGIEKRLGPPSLTLRTLELLKSEHPNWALRLVIGSDVLFESHKWHAFDKVTALAPFYVLGRIGVTHPHAPIPVLPEVSSSRVRELLARRGHGESNAELSCFVPRHVLEYIDEHELYR